jgi:hypothetical protein
MKKLVFLVILAVAIAAIPAFAQDFTSPRPQFLSFSIGVPIGYDLAASDLVVGKSFGLSFAIIDKLSVGYDFVSSGVGPRNFQLLRIAYSFTDNIGVALAFGQSGTAAVGFGAFFDMLPARSSVGVAYGLRLRVDYLANTNAFGDGAILFGIGAVFGL